LFDFAEPYRLRGEPGSDPQVLARACVSGLQTGPIVIEQPVRQEVLGVRLRAVGAAALLPAAMRDIRGLHVGLGDLFGAGAGELLERCQETRQVEARFRLVAAWLGERLARSRGVDEAIAWCAGQIERSGGRAAIAALRAETGMSRARLATLFEEQIGLKPKLYARAVRFRQVLGLLQRSEMPLSDAALAAGFYDQAHMNAEFRDLAGIPPSAFLAARHAVGDGSTSADLIG